MPVTRHQALLQAEKDHQERLKRRGSRRGRSGSSAAAAATPGPSSALPQAHPARPQQQVEACLPVLPHPDPLGQPPAQHLVDSVNTNLSRCILFKMESNITCTLCLELIANPYVVNNPKCGHSFCAICIAKWFFKALHDDCGCWHESVTCPICRSYMPHTKYDAPRSLISVPFSPNRALESFMQLVIDDGKMANSPRLLEWHERYRQGETFMKALHDKWETLDSKGFWDIKRSLGFEAERPYRGPLIAQELLPNPAAAGPVRRGT